MKSEKTAAPAVGISVVIPLYNKVATIERTLRSVFLQSTPPIEVIVVDDGSTDGGAEIAARFTTVRLIRQTNAGVSAARNRGLVEARGRYVALLDADDAWEPDYLAEITSLIACWPDCTAYATGFSIDSGSRTVIADTPRVRGVVDFFAESLRHYVLIPSATTLDRNTALSQGGFPEGMRMGEDQYLWTKLARAGNICFSPAPLVRYTKGAPNNSAALWKPEKTAASFEDLYLPAPTEESPAARFSREGQNEYIARVALGKALILSTKGCTSEAAHTANFFSYTRENRRALFKLRLLNALPLLLRAPLLKAYNAAAWLLAKKGL